MKTFVYKFASPQKFCILYSPYSSEAFYQSYNYYCARVVCETCESMGLGACSPAEILKSLKIEHESVDADVSITEKRES